MGVSRREPVTELKAWYPRSFVVDTSKGEILTAINSSRLSCSTFAVTSSGSAASAWKAQVAAIPCAPSPNQSPSARECRPRSGHLTEKRRYRVGKGCIIPPYEQRRGGFGDLASLTPRPQVEEHRPPPLSHQEFFAVPAWAIA